MRKKRIFVALISIAFVVFSCFFMIGSHENITSYTLKMRNNYFNDSNYLQNYLQDTFLELAYSVNATVSDSTPGNLFLSSKNENENVSVAQNLFSETIGESVANTKADPNIHFTVNTIDESISSGTNNLSTIANDPTLQANYRWYGIVTFDSKGKITPKFYYATEDQKHDPKLTLAYSELVENYEKKFIEQLDTTFYGNIDSQSIAQLKSDIDLLSPVSTSVVIAVPKTITYSGALNNAISSSADFSNDQIMVPYLFFVGLVAVGTALIAAILLHKDLRYRNNMKKVKLEVVLLIGISVAMIYSTFSLDFVREVSTGAAFTASSTLANGPFSFLSSSPALFIISVLYWGIYGMVNLYFFNYIFAFVTTGIVSSFNEQSLLVDFIRGLFNVTQRVAKDYSLTSRITAISAFLLGDLLLAIFGRKSMPVFIIFIAINSIVVLALIMYAFRISNEYKRILTLSDQLANSDFNTLIESDVKELQPLAIRLQEIQKEFERAVKEESLVQRQKADLITNVSHDLKTPLTTILTYTELMQHSDISEEDREKFRLILQKNALRLKTLIDDIFVVTELNNGITKVELTSIDIVSLLQQVQLDVQHLLDANELDLRLTISERPIMLNLDGERTSRIFENIFGNIAKYAQRGSRVYIDVDKYGDVVKIEFKNIANYEMLFDSESIYERFVQGDQSRNTEGTGLGLAIVKSLVELQGGKFEVTVDGDLFKAIIIFKTTN